MARRYTPLLFLLLLFILLPLPLRAAQTRLNNLEVAIEPPYAAPGDTVQVIVKNFSWSQTARLDVALVNHDGAGIQELTPDALLRLGPRRRASLAATPNQPGRWTAQPAGDWIFGSTVTAPSATVLVVTPGSSGGTIGPNQTVEGVVVPDETGAGLGAWVLDLAEETPVSFRIVWAAAHENDHLIVFDSAGDELAGGRSYIPALTLPPGRYLITPQSPVEQSYTLTLSPGLSGDSEDGATLQPGALFAGLISPRTDRDAFTVAAAPGDVIFLALNAATNTLDPQLTLLDPAGNEVAANDDAQGYNAALSYVAPVPGNYTVRAASANGNSEGEYTLEFALDPEMDRLAPPTLTTIGSGGSGETPPGGAQAWRFEGAAGRSVGIYVVGQSDGFDPKLTLYGPDGSQLAEVDDTNGLLNPLLNIELPDDGYYTIVVGSYSGAGGVYGLSVADGPLPTPAP